MTLVLSTGSVPAATRSVKTTYQEEPRPSIFDTDPFTEDFDWASVDAQDAARAEAQAQWDADRAAAEWYTTARLGSILQGMGL